MRIQLYKHMHIPWIASVRPYEKVVLKVTDAINTTQVSYREQSINKYHQPCILKMGLFSLQATALLRN